MSVPHLNTSEETQYFIAHNGIDIFHCGDVPPGEQVETGQPQLELFDSAERWSVRKNELGIQE